MSSAAYDLGPGNRAGLARRGGADLADILERVLDKGVVIAGDIAVNLLDIELVTIKLRLLVASADTARAMGIDWWTTDPFLSGKNRDLENENRSLRERVERLEAALAQLPAGTESSGGNGNGSSAGNARPAETVRGGVAE